VKDRHLLAKGEVSVNIKFLELLYFKQSIADLTLFSKEEIDFMIEYCCISWFLFSSISPFYHFIVLYSCTLYNFILNK